MRKSAENLRNELEKNKMTVSTLSKKTGVSMSSISQYLSGRCAPNPENAEKLAAVLGCSPTYILGFSPETKISDDPLVNEIGMEADTLSFKQKRHLLEYIRLIKEMNTED